MSGAASTGALKLHGTHLLVAGATGAGKGSVLWSAVRAMLPLNFRPIWTKARTSVGLPGLHFHDLRHTGGTLTAATGASLRELMARLGHSSVRAAMIYQHATRDRDQAIAKALGGLVREVREARNNQAERTEREA
jgi:integrase